MLCRLTLNTNIPIAAMAMVFKLRVLSNELDDVNN